MQVCGARSNGEIRASDDEAKGRKRVFVRRA
jgi:hypothetical protein